MQIGRLKNRAANDLLGGGRHHRIAAHVAGGEVGQIAVNADAADEGGVDRLHAEGRGRGGVFQGRKIDLNVVLLRAQNRLAAIGDGHRDLVGINRAGGQVWLRGLRQRAR